MTNAVQMISEALAHAPRPVMEGLDAIENLKQLSGGASQETWAFDARTNAGTKELILRRAPNGVATKRTTSSAGDHATEAAIIRLAHETGVPVPAVPYVLQEKDGIGPGYVMERIPGETIARKILRDEEYREARPKLAGQCGRILAGILHVDRTRLPALSVVGPKEQFAQFRETYDNYNYPHPVFEAAFKWLALSCRLGYRSWKDGGGCHATGAEHMRFDEDLELLRKDSRFMKLLGYSEE